MEKNNPFDTRSITFNLMNLNIVHMYQDLNHSNFWQLVLVIVSRTYNSIKNI